MGEAKVGLEGEADVSVLVVLAVRELRRGQSG
jgi:hypothetical protein